MTETQKTCFYKPPDYLHSLQESCQFMREPGMGTRLTKIGSVLFCPYHLPHSAPTHDTGRNTEETVNNIELKKNWSEHQIKQFNDDILKRLQLTYEADTPCNLTGVVFPGHFSAFNRDLPGVDFSGCKFAGGASFRGCTFHGYTRFINTQFSGGDVHFVGANFLETCEFGGARFSGGDAYFSHVQFSGGEAYFNEAHFSGGNAYFNNTDFTGGNAYFNDVQFLGGIADFSVSSLAQNDASTDTDFREIGFDNVIFSFPAQFNNRAFKDETSFRGAIFKSAPEFHGCTVHQDTIFPSIENFKDTKSDSAAHAYRTLRLAMKQQEAHEEEAMFWALEQRSKRNNLDLKQPKNWLPWALSWGYDVLSNYGLNAGLPARWLGSWLLYSTVIYACVAGSLEKLTSLSHWLGALEFSIAQMVRPFFIWSDYDGADIKAALGSDEFGFLIKMLATVDSIVSLTLVALFILAVRRRFRMQ